ncbi:MAG: hypothetical protein U0P45_13330 [Acidimicrobiales bacterium]
MTLHLLTLSSGSFRLDSGQPRGSASQDDENAPTIGTAANAFGSACDQPVDLSQPRAIVATPPSLLRTTVTLPSGPGGTGKGVDVHGTFALDRGRLTLEGPRLQAGEQWFAARISVRPPASPAGSAEALAFRVVRRSGAPFEPGGEEVVFEQVLEASDGAIEVRAEVGVLAELPAHWHRLALEVESVGKGKPLQGVWERPRLGTRAEVDASVAILTMPELFVEWNDGTPGVKTRAPSPILNPPFNTPTGRYSTEPDAPYLWLLAYMVDGASVTDGIAAHPDAGATIRRWTGGSPGIWSVAGKPTYSSSLSSLGWSGGVQPGMGTHPYGWYRLPITPMGGDGEADASFAGVWGVVLDDESAGSISPAADGAAQRFLDEATAKLHAILPVGSGRTGLTMAEAASLRTGLQAIGDAIVADTFVPAASASGDGLVGSFHHTYDLIDLRAGAVERTSSMEGSGSSYRVTTRCANQ